jgi:ketosteroid isomerase-like protein
MLANAEAKWAVIKATDSLLDHIANGRYRETLALFSEDADVTLVGSETGERATGPDGLRAFFSTLYAQSYRVLFTIDERTISLAGNVAWFVAEGTYHLSTGGEPAPYRLVGVLERRRDQWLWQLFAGSEPR